MHDILIRFFEDFQICGIIKTSPPKNLDFTRNFGGFVANVLH